MAVTPEAAGMNVRLKQIRLPLAAFELELDVEVSGRIIAIFGPSGSGKTSLLDLIAGLRKPKTALIQIDDAVLTDTGRGIRLSPQARGIGYVPQDLALFPHLTVQENLRFSPRAKAFPETGAQFERVIEVLQVGSVLDRRIGEISGGEKQRVALARALLSEPRLLLLDEPLTSLDSELKARILPLFTRIRDEFAVPMLYVTHDRDEVMRLADQVIVLDAGRVKRMGTPSEVFASDGYD